MLNCLLGSGARAEREMDLTREPGRAVSAIMSRTGLFFLLYPEAGMEFRCDVLKIGVCRRVVRRKQAANSCGKYGMGKKADRGHRAAMQGDSRETTPRTYCRPEIQLRWPG